MRSIEVEGAVAALDRSPRLSTTRVHAGMPGALEIDPVLVAEQLLAECLDRPARSASGEPAAPAARSSPRWNGPRPAAPSADHGPRYSSMRVPHEST